jgi:hypothetical protein
MMEIGDCEGLVLSTYRGNTKLDFKATEWKFMDWAEGYWCNKIRGIL